jgi:hypothetical protein
MLPSSEFLGRRAYLDELMPAPRYIENLAKEGVL